MLNKLILAVTYLCTIVTANWAVTTFGVVPIGFGFLAPAGVLFAGLAFTLRDLLHDVAGRWVVLGAIGVGALLSVVVSSPALALASALAFVVSELADWLVYEPLRRHGWLLAVAISNVVGLVVDSVLFLAVAFGSLAFLPGQLIGKAWATVVAVIALAAGRVAWRHQRIEA